MAECPETANELVQKLPSFQMSAEKNDKQGFTVVDDVFLLRKAVIYNPYKNEKNWRIVHRRFTEASGKSFTVKAIKDHVERLLALFKKDGEKLGKSETEEMYGEKERHLKQLLAFKEEFNPLTKRNRKIITRELFKDETTVSLPQSQNTGCTFQDIGCEVVNTSSRSSSSSSSGSVHSCSYTEEEVSLEENSPSVTGSLFFPTVAFTKEVVCTPKTSNCASGQLKVSRKRKMVEMMEGIRNKEMELEVRKLALREKKLELENRRISLDEKKSQFLLEMQQHLSTYQEMFQQQIDAQTKLIQHLLKVIPIEKVTKT